MYFIYKIYNIITIYIIITIIKLIDPDQKKKICTSSSSLFDEIIDNEIFDGKIKSKSKIFDDVTN